MVATELLKLAMETYEERKARLKKMVGEWPSADSCGLPFPFRVSLFALSFSFLSERFSSVHAKAALAYSLNE